MRREFARNVSVLRKCVSLSPRVRRTSAGSAAGAGAAAGSAAGAGAAGAGAAGASAGSMSIGNSDLVLLPYLL